MKQKLLRIVLIISLISIGLVSSVCCGNNDTTDTNGNGDNGPTTPEVVKGIGFSPQGWPSDMSGILDFYAEVGDMTDSGVMWNGGWRDDTVDGTDAGTVPDAAVTFAEASDIYGFTHYSVFGWRSGETIHLGVPSNDTDNWTNTKARNLFKSMLVDYAETYDPPFAFIGNENSAYYEQNSSDYENWIDFYNEAYDAIKEASPDTMVGTIFNYEHLAGMGELNGWTTSCWEALDLHDLSKIDILGVTVYPFLNYATAEEVPASYLDPLISRIGSKPIAITETGWPGEDLGPIDIQWEQSEQAQVTYLSRLGAMLDGKNVKIVTWLALYPMEGPIGSTDWEVFGSLSLRDSAGDKRPVYDEWLDFSP
jgi:hypothetical protein